MNSLRDRVPINPDVMMGKPTIRGLRITVEQILKRWPLVYQPKICSKSILN
ncbi:MAG: DUF433 domain-containing protein [Anaerolineales bacterium]|nr:DUF433 domain-containing protein [Anaerolineales bacterium]